MVTKTSKLLFRSTAEHKGRATYISPKNSSLNLLSYGRIIIGNNSRAVKISSPNEEIGLICVSGEAEVLIDGQKNKIRQYDAMYIPCGSEAIISTLKEVDIIEARARTTKRSKPAVVQFQEIKNDEKYHIRTGGMSCVRDIFTLIGDNVPASRLVCGITFSHPGNWTSWPPHEHTRTKEEIYIYINMPSPAFGIQLVYKNFRQMDLVQVVRENDAVVIPGGYHPNVACPGHPINFVWIMAGKREKKDRNLEKITQPDFK